MATLMKNIRASLSEGKFEEFKSDFEKKYRSKEK